MQSDEAALLRAATADPADALARLVLADYYDERGDRRGAYLRARVELAPLPPDHPLRPAAEEAWSAARVGVDAEWLARFEPAERHPPGRPCRCYGSTGRLRGGGLVLHAHAQDTECDGWKRLLDLVEDAAADRREEFAPGRHIPRADWEQVVTLPASVGKLVLIRHLNLYGSRLVRLPPEVGAMASLGEFTPYTSYRLHWYPYEVARCVNLRGSTVSTRSLYGNRQHRPPFPVLGPYPPAVPVVERPCSVCRTPFPDRGEHRVWVSLRVATDILPLLVNACSAVCVQRLPAGADDHVRHPHHGGPGVTQPARQ